MALVATGLQRLCQDDGKWVLEIEQWLWLHHSGFSWIDCRPIGLRLRRQQSLLCMGEAQRFVR